MCKKRDQLQCSIFTSKGGGYYRIQRRGKIPPRILPSEGPYAVAQSLTTGEKEKKTSIWISDHVEALSQDLLGKEGSAADHRLRGGTIDEELRTLFQGSRQR